MDWITTVRNKNIERGLTFNPDKQIEKVETNQDAEDQTEDRTNIIGTIHYGLTGLGSTGGRKKEIGPSKNRHAKLPKKPKRSAVHKHKR